MIKTVIARRYAKALFGLGDPSSLESIRVGLSELARAISESPSLKHVLVSPALGVEQKSEILSALLERLGCPPVLTRFVAQLLKKGRIAVLPEIAEEFDALVDEAKGIQRVAVVSGRPLTQAEQERFQRRLRESLRHNVNLTFRTDPGLLSGLQIQIGSTVYDSSVRGRLTAMKAALTKE